MNANQSYLNEETFHISVVAVAGALVASRVGQVGGALRGWLAGGLELRAINVVLARIAIQELIVEVLVVAVGVIHAQNTLNDLLRL